MPAHRRKAYLLLALVSVIWGFATYVIKITSQEIDPLSFLTYRFAISAIFGILMLLVFHGFAKITKNFLVVTVYSFITTTVALGFLFLGIEKTTILDTALIIAVGPLVTAILGVIFLKEVVTKKEKIGITLALAGTLVTIFAPIVSGMEALQFKGNVLVLLYLLTAGVSAVMSKKLLRKDIDPFALTNFSFIVGFATILPIALFQTHLPTLLSTVSNLTLSGHLGVWYMAFISGTLAYALWVKAQKSIEVSEAGVFGYLNAVLAVPFGIWLLGEKLTTPLILGAILIVIGVIIAETKRRG